MKDTKQKELKTFEFNYHFKINHSNIKNQDKFNKIYTIVNKPKNAETGL